MDFVLFNALFVVFLVTKVNAGTSGRQDINAIIRAITDGVGTSKKNEATPNGCQCVEYNCGCCMDMFDNPGCVNITYLPEQFAISVLFTFNGEVIFNKTISAQDPPPLCFPVPYLKEFQVNLCVDFYGLKIDTSIHGCVEIRVELFNVVKEDVDLGCFKIPLHHSLLFQHSKMVEQRKWINTMALMREKRLQELSKNMAGA